jgi:hypothetical protein
MRFFGRFSRLVTSVRVVLLAPCEGFAWTDRLYMELERELDIDIHGDSDTDCIPLQAHDTFTTSTTKKKLSQSSSTTGC